MGIHQMGEAVSSAFNKMSGRKPLTGTADERLQVILQALPFFTNPIYD